MKLQAPAFWFREKSLRASLLTPIGWLYGFFASLGLRRKGKAVDLPVIAVGNFTLGGGGKTPLVRWLRKFFTQEGVKVAVISRGYGGELKAATQVNLEKHRAVDVGDEALLHAADGLTIIGGDRAEAARLAKAAGAELILLDDGVQSRQIGMDLVLMTIDPSRGFGNGKVFPAGPLRAPIKAQLPLVSATIAPGSGRGAGLEFDRKTRAELPHFRADLIVDPADAASLEGMAVLGFAGIANPARFEATLHEIGAQVALFKSFGDHHRYSDDEALELLQSSKALGLQLVTTEKDAVRFQGREGLGAELLAASVVLQAWLRWSDASFETFLREFAKTKLSRDKQG